MDQINKRYAGAFRLVTFLNVLSYIVIMLGVLAFAGGGRILWHMSQFDEGHSLVYLVTFGSFGFSLLIAVALQGCSSVLKAVTDTAVVALWSMRQSPMSKTPG